MRALAVLLAVAAGVQAFPVPKPAQTPNVAGTTWEGTTKWSTGTTKSNLKVTFAEGGKLIYGVSKSTANTWEQNGNVVTWTINNYSHYTATISGETLEGTASNKVKNTAVVTLTKVESK